jgi:CheY-like chemotaxis protein
MHPRRILAVDDAPSILALLQRALESVGYEVMPAASGEEALAHCALMLPDAAIIDLNLPGLSGQELCQRIKAQRPIPVIFITGNATLEALGLAHACAAEGLLQKPFHLDTLFSSLQQALEHTSAALQEREVGR